MAGEVLKEAMKVTASNENEDSSKTNFDELPIIWVLGKFSVVYTIL